MPNQPGTAKAPIIRAANSGNFGSRSNVPVDTLVIHVTQSMRNAAQIMAGATPSAVMWFADPKAGASAHYVVSTDGTVFACVPEGICAWHAGNSAMNRRSIGVELEGFIDKPATFNPEAMASLVRLCADIVKRHKIPVLRQPGPGICGHADVPDPQNPNMRGGLHHHVDPGSLFPWDSFFASLRDELAAGVA